MTIKPPNRLLPWSEREREREVRNYSTGYCNVRTCSIAAVLAHCFTLASGFRWIHRYRACCLVSLITWTRTREPHTIFSFVYNIHIHVMCYMYAKQSSRCICVWSLAFLISNCFLNTIRLLNQLESYYMN